MTSDAPVLRYARFVLKRMCTPVVFRVPAAFRPILRVPYEARWVITWLIRTAVAVLIRGPLFQSRCAKFGRGVRMEGPMPWVVGYPHIEIGNGCYIGGKVQIVSGSVHENPRFIMEDGAELSWNCIVIASKEVVIEQGARVANNCAITDTDGHPREADRRANDEAPDSRDVRPVRICRHAWIGNSSHIMKGVTVGEGAVVAANSVVMTNVPPYSLAVGNPAEILMRNYGLPSDRRKTASRPRADEAADLTGDRSR